MLKNISTVERQYIAVLRVHNPETAMWSERDISPDMYHACIQRA